jgi:hypothetical protein
MSPIIGPGHHTRRAREADPDALPFVDRAPLHMRHQG